MIVTHDNIEYTFGANILENLTTGMYQDSKVIYREYIQNACDQIDKAVASGLLNSKKEGKIEIWLSPEDRTISIEDNATGIPYADFKRVLANIADSDKKIGKDKGFRGIGRLCGLAYCRELIFSSKAAGESKISIMRCDAQKMRELIIQNNNGEKISANEVLESIYKFDEKDTDDIDSHWFKVEMIGINSENTDLLDKAQILEYLSFIVPVPYCNTFYYQTEIKKHAQEIDFEIDEYNIYLEGQQIFKKYSTNFKTSKGEDEIFSIEFKDIYDEDTNELLCWLWFGVSRFRGVISKDCRMRGLRLRKENIQIGNEDALQKLFSEDRGQHYFIGEVFGVSKNLIPNSQRDYFNENATRVSFEKELKRYFKSLHDIYHYCSEINSAYDKIDKSIHMTAEHDKKISNNDYNDSQHQSDQQAKVDEAAKKAQEALVKIEKKKSLNNSVSDVVNKIIDRIENTRQKENKPTTTTPPTPHKKANNNTPKSTHRTDKLSRCNNKERKLIGKIYNIIINSTDEKTAEKIINNIEEEFK